jgi:hypothetical protein
LSTNNGPPLAPGDLFTSAEAAYGELLNRRREGLEIRSFRAQVAGLMVADGSGQDWVIGPEDGAWYRRDGDRWVAAKPPRPVACPSCGHHNLHRHSFCTQCGTLLARKSSGQLPASPGHGL